MKVKNAIIWFNSTGLTESCKVEVPGIGTIEMTDCISDDLKERLDVEIITALKHKLKVKD